MRMWNIDPKLMCDKHLLGEHVEMHMFAGCLRLGKNIQGYIDRGLVEVENIYVRHELLAYEMVSRGFNHKSPMKLIFGPTAGFVNREKSMKDLSSRCVQCRLRIKANRRNS